ncbi:Uncharacterized protein GBIM_18172 [Gryllus bimaculatus]|nr:Uncharacterized protein GBIM_18172 [Gryllus bimaculatus]
MSLTRTRVARINFRTTDHPTMSNPDKSEDHLGDVATRPSWLDTQLIRQALRNGGEENPVVASISVRHAVAPGENYISTVYRVMATLSDGRQRHFIIKGPAIGGMSEMAKGTCVFQREIDMFTDYIPKMELSHVSSPAIDVLHVFSNSLSDDVDEHHQPFLLREYHFELKTTLELLGHEAPSPAWLERSLDAHGAYAVFTALETPLVKAERGVDVAALSGGDCASFLRLLRTPPLRRRMQRKLEDYARRGWLPA